MIIAALEKKGVDPGDFVLHIVNGILIEYTCVGRYIYPSAPRSAGGDGLLRVRCASSPELATDLDHRGPAATRARQPGAGDRVLADHRDGLYRCDARARIRHRHDRAVFPFCDQCRHGFFRGHLQAAGVSQGLGATDEGALRGHHGCGNEAAHDDIAEHGVADPATAAQQYRTPGDHGDRLRAGRCRRNHDHAVARRGARAACRGGDPRRCGAAAHRGARDRRGRYHRSAGRLVLRGDR